MSFDEGSWRWISQLHSDSAPTRVTSMVHYIYFVMASALETHLNVQVCGGLPESDGDKMSKQNLIFEA